MANIKVFIKKISFFLSIPIILVSIILAFTNRKVEKTISGLNKDQSIKMLFMGDSHIQKGIIDSLIPNSANVAQNSESFYFTYFKIKKLFKSGVKVKSIYLGYSYHSISNYYEDFIFGQNSKFIAPKYFFILPNKQKIKMFVSNRDNLGLFVLNIIKDGLNPYNYYIGQYANKFKNTKANKSSMDKRLELQYLDGLNEISAINCHYFNAILELCRQNEVQLVLVNTPLHPYYKAKIPSKFVGKYEELIKIGKLQVINFNDLKLEPYSFIPDGDHVSSEGAILTTNELYKILNKTIVK